MAQACTESTDLSSELLKCIEECAPGPHAFLLLLKVEKYTRQEQAVVDVILKYFSEEALKYTTVVFTHGDNLPETEKIEDWARKNEKLKLLIEKCGGRCLVLDNKYWDNKQDPYRNNQVQIRELLNTINITVEKNGGSCYTNKMLQRVATDKSFLVTLVGVSTGVLLGALLGVPVMVAVILSPRGTLLGVPGETVALGGLTIVGGAAYGGYRGYKAAEQERERERKGERRKGGA
ncbi:hypothetical protein WMY93_014635 [Mugilogobius chulae]|uniref:AIG1-type G domain-containing protein n=1 Tax=Mugilogobius chulae TaxID=88201 RepID=A0AAW0NZK7_9GOBI